MSGGILGEAGIIWIFQNWARPWRKPEGRAEARPLQQGGTIHSAVLRTSVSCPLHEAAIGGRIVLPPEEDATCATLAFLELPSG